MSVVMKNTLSRRHFMLGTGALAAAAAIPNVLFANTGGAPRGWWS
jgi:TAT (twin-arginine translocation) pathway signal sequence